MHIPKSPAKVRKISDIYKKICTFDADLLISWRIEGTDEPVMKIGEIARECEELLIRERLEIALGLLKQAFVYRADLTTSIDAKTPRFSTQRFHNNL